MVKEAHRGFQLAGGGGDIHPHLYATSNSHSHFNIDGSIATFEFQPTIMVVSKGQNVLSESYLRTLLITMVTEKSVASYFATEVNCMD